MPKTVFSKRQDLICGKIENLVSKIKILKLSDIEKVYMIEILNDIQNDAQRMEDKLVFRKQEAEEYKTEIRHLNCKVL
jgi:hypothetical protein